MTTPAKSPAEKQRIWRIGQRWLTPEGVTYKVIYIRKNGMASLRMKVPYDLAKCFSQKEIPDTWTLI